jgi:hypothetical protein
MTAPELQRSSPPPPQAFRVAAAFAEAFHVVLQLGDGGEDPLLGSFHSETAPA